MFASTAIVPAAAPAVCPCCGRAVVTEPQLPKLPRRGRPHPTDSAIWITGDGRWITIA